MKQLLSALAAVLLLASPASAQMTGIIGGGVDAGSAAASSMISQGVGIRFYNNAMLAGGALTQPGGGQGCQGTGAWRLFAMNDLVNAFAVQGNMNTGFVFQNGHSGANENMPGWNFIPDAIGLRFNMGDVNWNGSTGKYSLWRVNNVGYTNPASTNDAWGNYLVSWNFCSATTPYSALYFNGQQVSTYAAANSSLPAEIGWSTTTNGNFIIGSNWAGLQSWYETDDLVLDTGSNGTSNSGIVCTGASTPSACGDVGGVGQCTLSTSGPHCAANMIPDVYVNRYYASGKAQRINRNSNCDGLLGYKPSLCFTTDGGGPNPTYNATNFFNSMSTTGPCAPHACGSDTAGGTWSWLGMTGSSATPAGIPVNGLAPKTVGHVFDTSTIAAPVISGSGPWTITTLPTAHVIQNGDLLLMSVMVNTYTNTSLACPSTGTWTAVYPLYVGVQYGAAFNVLTCWAIAGQGGVDTSGSYTMGWSAGNNQANWLLQVFRGVDTTSPIDVYNLVDNANYTSWLAPRMANVITNYANEVVVGLNVNSSSWNPSGLSAWPSGVNVRNTWVPYPSGYGQWAAWDQTYTTPQQTAFQTLTYANAIPSVSVAIGLKPAGAAFQGVAAGSYALRGAGTVRAPTNSDGITVRCWGVGGGAQGHSGHAGGGGGAAYADNTATIASAGTLLYYSLPYGGPNQSSNGLTGADGWINTDGNNVEPDGSTQHGCMAKGGIGNTGSAPAGGSGAASVGANTESGAAGGYSGSGASGGGGAGGYPTSIAATVGGSNVQSKHSPGGGSGVISSGGSGYTANISSGGYLTWAGSGCSVNPTLTATTSGGGAVATIPSTYTATANSDGWCQSYPIGAQTTWTAGGTISYSAGTPASITLLQGGSGGIGINGGWTSTEDGGLPGGGGGGAWNNGIGCGNGWQGCGGTGGPALGIITF